MRHNKFTLVELLVVICIASLLMGVVLPAFNRLVTGSAVDRLASNLKLRLERAQSHAASSRRYVAVILPHGPDWINDAAKAPYGGSRMCYVDVDLDNETVTFKKWVPDENWILPERGAALLRVLDCDVDSLDPNDEFANEGEPQEILVGDTLKVATNSDNKGKETKLCKDGDLTAPLSKIDGLDADPDSSDGPEMTALTGGAKNCAIIFSPNGGVFTKNTNNVYLLLAEAYDNGGKWLFPNNGIHNFRVLEINRITGKVRHFRR